MSSDADSFLCDDEANKNIYYSLDLNKPLRLVSACLVELFLCLHPGDLLIYLHEIFPCLETSITLYYCICDEILTMPVKVSERLNYGTLKSRMRP